MGDKELADEAERIAALTQIGRSLLVEAGAGCGKTSIMAGRVAFLLAEGVEPKNVAAITFTEFAASELRIRIEKFVGDLAAGTIPPDVACAFPKGVTATQIASLAEARKTLDQLLCTTIHGFAQALIKPYPAEAGIDPGAEIVDPSEGDLAFHELYETWLRGQLSGNQADGVIPELIVADEKPALELIKSIADFLRHNRDARPVDHLWSADHADRFLEAANAFDGELKDLSFGEEKTGAACQAFLDLARAIGESQIAAANPSDRALIEVASMPRSLTCFTQNGSKRVLRAKGAWEQAAVAVGKSKREAGIAYDACQARYDSCHQCFAEITAQVAGELLERATNSLTCLLELWSQYKRTAALLDFDDLLYAARDLLVSHEEVLQALSKRFRHVLVDEFQDTDPLQIEILWRLCGERPADGSTNVFARVPRAGALFLVGDPKQAIYRFRGADVNAYLGARQAMGESAILKVVANFRSVGPILSFVNGRFDSPLSSAAGQPGFTALVGTRSAEKGILAVAALDIASEQDQSAANVLRDKEAEKVAELCTRLVGNLQIADSQTRRPCRFGDIALLAPVGTDLWRFEEALERRGVPVSSQAGKGFFRRQEVQDLIAVTRAIADARDTLALGALLRGPLVGLTEAELLDIAEALPAHRDHPDQLQHLTLWTDPKHVNHELARRVLTILQSLAKQVRSTTPCILLSDAVSLLGVRAQLRQRFRTSADRALANVDLFIEMSRAYDVRGLRAFARDMRADWEEQERQVEGRSDAEEQSVSLITVHASKGLEWPVVIPINMTGVPKSESGLMHDRRSSQFSVPILGIEPPGYDAIRSWNEAEQSRERVRLWYVASTRARDLLVLPRHAAKVPDRSWAKIVDLDIAALPPIEPESLGAEVAPPTAPPENAQTGTIFVQEAKRIAEATAKISWHRPSRHEEEGPTLEPVGVFADPVTIEEAPAVVEVAGSATRGTILHKLIEEVLTGESKDSAAELEARARDLLAQVGVEASTDPSRGIAPAELAATILRTLGIPEIAALRPRLVPELSVYGQERTADVETLISGIADAVAPYPDGRIEAVIDWKSDVELKSEALTAYKTQVRDYCRQLGAERAIIVFMTLGKIIEA